MHVTKPDVIDASGALQVCVGGTKVEVKLQFMQ